MLIEYINEKGCSFKLNFLYIKLSKLTNQIINKIKNDSTLVLLLDFDNHDKLALFIAFFC